MTLYSNLHYTQGWLETAQTITSTLTQQQQILLQAIRAVSLRLDNEFPTNPRAPYFAPWYGSRPFLVPYPSTMVNSRLNTFQFRDNLMALTGDVTQGARTLVDGTNVEVFPVGSYPPYHALHLLGCCYSWYDNCGACNTPLEVTIPGVWCWHRDWANAYFEATTLNGALTSTQTTVTFANLDAPDADGFVPAISIGTLFQIDDGTDELLEVVNNWDATANTALVRRGVNGTTKVAHTDATAGVLVFQVDPVIQQAVARQAAAIYARRAKYNTLEVVGMSEVRYPQDWLGEVRAAMGTVDYGY